MLQGMSGDVPTPIDLTQPPWRPADTFGARLALVRQRLGLNVTQAAALCGVPQASWHTWERGVQPQRLYDIVDKIVEGTGVERDWLLGGGNLAPASSASSSVRSRCITPGGQRRHPGEFELPFPRDGVTLLPEYAREILARGDVAIDVVEEPARVFATASGM